MNLDDVQSQSDLLQQAAEIISSGELGIFPTETVYGIGALYRAPGAREKLAAAKERPADQPFTVHIGSMEQLDELVNEVPEKIRRVVDTFWPGPMTIIIPDGTKI